MASFTPPFRPFLLIFLMIPLIEIALFAAMGDAIGAGGTLLLCLLSGGFGIYILQEQGLSKMMAQTRQIRDESQILPELFDGLCIALAGGLLVVPGFFTDFLAICLLIPPVRALFRAYIIRNFFGDISFTAPPGRDSGPYIRDAIDGEYERVEEDKD